MALQMLFIDAVQAGTMEGFYKLISYFQTQSEPAYCGLASLSMVLNALAIDPRRKWKGASCPVHLINSDKCRFLFWFIKLRLFLFMCDSLVFGWGVGLDMTQEAIWLQDHHTYSLD